MFRTQIYLTNTQKTRLIALQQRIHKSQSELIREAIDDFMTRHSQTERDKILNSAAGMWKNRKDLSQLQLLRKTWDRAHD